MEYRPIVIRGLKQNNLKNVSLEIPKNKIVVFTGVSGSGKSSIVFDTIAAESQRQMNEALLISGTLTGNAMKEVIPFKEKPRKPTGFLPVRGANLHNVKNVDVDIPLGVLTVVTGVAGSGKSSLIRDAFAKQYEDKVVLVDQSAVTATGRSTACTYLGFFDEIRKVFAKASGKDASLFSFNGKGACPECKGRGTITTELVFMEPVTTVCECCGGKRYNEEALSCRYRGKNIVEVLDMSVEDAAESETDKRAWKRRKHLCAGRADHRASCIGY